MDVFEALNRRRAIRAFEPDGMLLSRETIEELVADACVAPSEFNLQPWKFIVVRDRERRQILYECSYKQAKVRDASAVLIVLGDLLAAENAPRVVEDQVRKAIVRTEDASGLAGSILRVYQESEWSRVLLAVRNPCFMAMAIMLLATERGIATCPIGGFSEPDLRREFHIPDRYVPLLLIAMGMRSTTVQQPPRASRFPVSELVVHEDMAP